MATSKFIDAVGLFFCFTCFVFPALGASPLITFNETSHKIFRREHNSHQVNATVPIIFEGRSYSTFFISVDGHIIFTTEKSAVRYHPQDWSVKDVAQFIDLPFIAPYYYRAQPLDSRTDYTGSVLYQTIDDRDPRDQVQINTLRYLGRYIQNNVVGSHGFNPTWAIQVTWSNVTSEIDVSTNTCDPSGAGVPCPTNTFQLVLMTSGTQSYVIFNYDKMEMTPSPYDQAGFNGGYGQGFTSIVKDSSAINQLNREKGSDVIGRFIYRISSGKVTRGGCTNNKYYSELSVSPNYAGMFGGRMIDISGPCFRSDQQIMCKFGDENKMQGESQSPPVDPAIYVSETRVRCVVPKLLFRDIVPLSISTDGGRTYQYSTSFTVVFPGRMPSAEHVTAVFTDADYGWYSHNPTRLTVKWNPDLLSNSSSSLVSIQLIGYNEAGGKAQYTPLTMLGTNIRNFDGQYTIDAQDYQCTDDDCFNFEVGLLEVTLIDQFTPQEYRFLSSKVIPLGWYVQNAMVSKYGSEWPTSMCVNWYDKDSKDMTWLNSLLSCPCTLEQAMSDFGRWQTDHGCDINRADQPYNCFYHKSAVHCVRAVQPTAGGGNQCCYGRSGILIYAADSNQGSTPDKSHDWGAAPYGRPGYVPSLSHWIDDVVTFYYCCIWTGYKSCDYYMDLRPTKDCTGYTPPTPASVYGQGHIVTFGSDKYRMHGPGDYILLSAGNTMVQGRFQTNPFLNTVKRNATFSLTGVAIQDKGVSDKVVLEMRGPNTNNKNIAIDVRVNGVYIKFDDSAMKWQDFNGVAVINSDPRQQMSNFTVLLTNGIGFQVAVVMHTLQIDLMMPGNSFKNISGLFGDLDGTLQTPDGNTTLNPYNSSPEIFYNFQLHWAANDSNRLFGDLLQANHSLNRQVNLRPVPSVNNRNVPFCSTPFGLSDDCAFDYKFTGSQEMAVATRTAFVRNVYLRDSLQPVRSCGLLDVPRSKKTSYRTTIGTETSITSCRTGSLSGPSSYTCVATSNTTQSWSPDVTSTCEEQVEDANIGLIVGVAVGVGVVVLTAIVVAIILVKRRSKQKWKRSGEAKTSEEKVTMKTAV
ncbi:hypothetical protein ACF0H5_011225 [Mactra antiquata]